MPPPSVNPSKKEFEVNQGPIRNSFKGLLHKISTEPRPMFSIAKPVFRRSKLSVLDITRVNQATIREGESHCVWPPAILQRFRTAEVITDSKTKHYQVTDGNLRKVS